IGEAAPQSEPEARADVADAVELVPHPALLERLPHLRTRIAGEPGKHGLGRDHAGFHRGMAALELLDVQEPGGVADQRAAGKIEARDRLKAALVQSARAIGDAPPAFEGRADRRMRLETLKLLERVQERVVIVEPDHKPDRDLAIFEVVQKRAAIGAAVEWPADGVDDESGLVAL